MPKDCAFHADMERLTKRGYSLPQSLALALHVLPANVAANQPVLKCPAAVW